MFKGHFWDYPENRPLRVIGIQINMEKEKMGFKKFTYELIRLLLQLDNEEEVLSVPEVVKAWYFFFYFIIIGTFLHLWVNICCPRGSNYETTYTFVIRIVDVIYYVCVLLLFFILIFNNYKFLMIKGKNLKLGNLFFYYVIGTLIFGKIYGSIYVLNQNYFKYFNPPIQITDVVQGGLKAFMLGIDFIIYSFLSSLSAEYYRIIPNHNWISILNVVQLLFTFFILSILVTLFLQKMKLSDSEEIGDVSKRDTPYLSVPK